MTNDPSVAADDSLSDFQRGCGGGSESEALVVLITCRPRILCTVRRDSGNFFVVVAVGPPTGFRYYHYSVNNIGNKPTYVAHTQRTDSGGKVMDFDLITCSPLATRS